MSDQGDLGTDSCVKLTSSVVKSLDLTSTLAAKIVRLRACIGQEIFAGPAVFGALSQAGIACATISAALQDVQQAYRKHRDLEKRAVGDHLAELQSFGSELLSLQVVLETICRSARMSKLDLFAQGTFLGLIEC